MTAPAGIASVPFRLMLGATVLGFGGYALLLPVVPLWVAGEGKLAAGATTGVLMLTTIVTQLAVPWLVARFGYRVVLAVGLAVLGLWLGVAFYKTNALWLPMGLHSGGILAIGVHRCFTNYRGPAMLVGTQTFPIAGLISIVIMLIGSAVTWFLF